MLVIVGFNELGKYIARKFAQKGYSIGIVDEKERFEMQSFPEASKVKVVSATADFSDKKSMHEAFIEIHDALGDPGILIYNKLPTFVPQTVLDVSQDDLTASFKSVIGGALLSVQAVMENMQENSSGTILFTDVPKCTKFEHNLVAFTTISFALRGFVESICGEAKQNGIHVGRVVVGSEESNSISISLEEETFWKVTEKYWEIHKQGRKNWTGAILACE